jgi:plastocyanin
VPALVELSPGETVTWMNDDGAPHNIFVKNRPASETLISGSSYSTNFEHPGDYEYLCSIHPYMMGKINVTGRRAALVTR